LTIEEIVELSKRMERETKAVKDELYRYCWYMRGSLSITEAFELSTEDREIIGKIITDNLETTKKSKLPFF
jgi:hypothetical protein